MNPPGHGDPEKLLRILDIATRCRGELQHDFAIHHLVRLFGNEIKDIDERELKNLIQELIHYELIEYGQFNGATSYKVTTKGHTEVFHCRMQGSKRLLLNSSSQGPSIHIGQGAAAPVQANVNTGSGTIHATQTNTLGASEQAEVLRLLRQLQETVDALPDSHEQKAAQHIVTSATMEAEQNRWRGVGERIPVILATLGLIVSTTADSQGAIETTKRVLHALGLGT